jgi:uncharacterized membrane protein HdeD (DUF308 family)
MNIFTHPHKRSLLTLVTLVGVWAIVHGVTEIFAAFTLRQAGSGWSNWPADRERAGSHPTGGRANRL